MIETRPQRGAQADHILLDTLHVEIHEESEPIVIAPYEAMLAALNAVPWDRAPEVIPIRPLDRANIDFFPGHRGFVGPKFPHRDGVMVVGNNFSSVSGWKDYCKSPDLQSEIATWRKLRVIIHASGLGIERFWFTNYCHGVMERNSESYRFPKSVVTSLEFDELFAKCVRVMRPALIVSLGKLASDLLGTDYKHREMIERRKIAGHSTKLIAAVHPSAWTWAKRGFSIEDFKSEGERIRAAFQAP